LNPKKKRLQEKLWQAESKAFDEQDWESAINGDSLGFFKGFKQISKKYSGQNAGKIAQYNLGISLLNNKEYENAIIELKKVNFQDELLGTISQGAIGDAYMQLGAVSDAFVYYEKAYQRKENELTTPLYLMRAALCLEIEENYFKSY
jgi:predicted negative regulator of RcsB-dependent stress response